MKTLEKYLRIAGYQLQVNEYRSGSDFTLAGIQTGHCLYRYYDISIERSHLSNLCHHCDLLSTRPAYRKYLKGDNEESRVTDGKVKTD